MTETVLNFLRIPSGLLLCLGLAVGLQAQPTLWQTCAGGENAEMARALVNATDGAHVIAGFTRSGTFTGATRNTPGSPPRLDSDAVLSKVSSRGRVLWSKCYGGTYTEEANAIALTPEGGYVLAGHSNSSEYSKGEQDFYVVRTDKLGEQLWAKGYGGAAKDVAYTIIPLPDGGYIVAGETSSLQTGDVTANRGGVDAWVIRIDKDGNLLWERNMGGTLNDKFYSGVLLDDNTVLLVGSTESKNYDATTNHGRTDMFVACIGIDKSVLWTKCFGGTMNDDAYSVARANDGNLVVCGTTFSSDGDVDTAYGQGDIWVVKFDRNGQILWDKTFGGSRSDGANGITATFDGHYIVAGTTNSNDGEVTGYHALYDGWVVKLNSEGRLQWQKALGGNQKDEFYAVVESAGGDYVVAGQSSSKDGDLLGLQRGAMADCYLVALTDPDIQNRANSLTPTVLMGYIRDSVTNAFVEAEVVLVDNNNNRTIYSGKSDKQFGIYTVLMPDTLQMSIGVFAKGYFLHSENILITNLQRYGEVRHDILLRPIRVGSHVDLYNIRFDTGSDNLRQDSRYELDRLAEFLKRNPNIRIRINGHTDSTGDPATKGILSERRAKQVKLYLTGVGIAPARMETKGWGMSRPLVPENTDYDRQLNRRVEIEVIGI